jgi:hypothetical protein
MALDYLEVIMEFESIKSISPIHPTTKFIIIEESVKWLKVMQ